MEDYKSFVPNQAYLIIKEWLLDYNCKIVIKNARESKNGDYRSPFKSNTHIISINNNLNKYSFLITLTHEIAHMITWDMYKSKVKPHGKEWKKTFKILLLRIIYIFPNDIQQCLAIHLKNPMASSNSDYNLVKTLRKYDKKPTLTISDIPFGSIFSTPNGKKYVKNKKIRTRFQCKSLNNNKIYLFNPLAAVQI